MKRVWLYALLCAETVLCIIAALAFSPPDAGGLITAQQIPFAQVGNALRLLSLSGEAGNAFAIVLYIIICCIPAVFLLVKLIKKRAKSEDAMLAAMSGYLFYLIYMMINPGNMGSMSAGSGSFGKAVLGGVFWSMLIGWLALKLLRFVKGKDTASILKMLGALFTLAAIFIVFCSAYINLCGLKASIKALEAGNTDTYGSIMAGLPIGDIGTYDALVPTKVFLVFRYIAAQIPCVLDILILLTAVTLAQQLKTERYGADVINTSGKLASLCRYAVVIVILGSIALNLLQIIFSESLRSMNFDNTLPLESIILSLGMLLLSRYFAGSRKLKQENEAFV